MSRAKLVQGNEACVKGALAVGCKFYGGYPITPSSEIAEHMVRAMPEVGGVFIQMEDEIASLASVIGASLGGSKAMTATSGPGFSLMQEHIGFAIMAEVPCVIVNVMRGGPSTGMPTSPSQGDVMQARWGTHGDHPAIVLAPSSVGEVFELTVKAFNLAERFRTPVILLYDEIIGHTRESVVLPDSVTVVERARPGAETEDFWPKKAASDGVPEMAAFGDGHRFHVTGLAHDTRGFPTDDSSVAEALITRLHDKIEAHTDEIIEVETHMMDDAEIAIFAYGIVGRSAREAVDRARADGIKAGLIRPLTLWPFPNAQVAEAAQQVDTIVVAEMNLGQLIGEVERAAGGRAEIVGHLRADGEPITPSALRDVLAKLDGGNA
ncbi:MAG: 2-oxoacid:acceptor oxidoreductase subunit alpha [Actinomycetota bacterium]|nr:2-oxoacid:acceptor oxidoreductase subunit alpha [Actinomycetota bacterium]MDK1103195.1 2-oxoacid:acceptor oxidoreductase subunit alpha [Actinomycetota bacterium]